MGRDWDDFEPKEYQEWCERWARECKRVLKPGGHMLAFSGNRTHHRLFTGVEDAGFEIRYFNADHGYYDPAKAGDDWEAYEWQTADQFTLFEPVECVPNGSIGKQRFFGKLAL